MTVSYEKVQLSCDNSFNQLYSLESILQFTIEVCQEKEFAAIYYNLPPKDKFSLSRERNHYINMLNLALERVSDLKEINCRLESSIAGL